MLAVDAESMYLPYGFTVASPLRIILATIPSDFIEGQRYGSLAVTVYHIKPVADLIVRIFINR